MAPFGALVALLLCLTTAVQARVLGEMVDLSHNAIASAQSMACIAQQPITTPSISLVVPVAIFPTNGGPRQV
jgi:hypothetical protein